MSSLYRQLRSGTRFLRQNLPSFLRQSSVLQSLGQKVERFIERLASHDVIYDQDYYTRVVDPPALEAAPVIADSIMSSFHPRRIVDVGCGTGALLCELRRKDCLCQGLEYSEAGLAICRQRGLDVTKFDIEADERQQGLGHFDVAVSLEVAEHLPASQADKLVDLLTHLSDTVVFTAAPPGQGGTDHVNEQPREYWVTKFLARNFEYKELLTRDWAEVWKRKELAHYYWANLMIFIKQA